MTKFSIKKLHKSLRKATTAEQVIALAMKWEPLCTSNADWNAFCKALLETVMNRQTAFLSYFAKQGTGPGQIVGRETVLALSIFVALGIFPKNGPHIASAVIADQTLIAPTAHDLASLRLLLWAGLDANVPLDTGATALQWACYFDNEPWAHPRAIRMLLNAGANPNQSGDDDEVPLLTLCNQENWSDQMTEAANILIDGGADIELANKNELPLVGILWAHQATEPHEARLRLIARLQAIMEAPIEEALAEPTTALNGGAQAAPAVQPVPARTASLRI